MSVFSHSLLISASVILPAWWMVLTSQMYSLNFAEVFIMLGAGGLVSLFLARFVNKISHHNQGEGYHGVAELVAVAGDGVEELILGYDTLEGVAHGSEDDVPKACTDGGVEDEMGEAHLGEACGNGDEVTDARHEAPDEGSYGAMIGEVLLGVLHFLLIEEAEVAEGAIGKGVDDGTSEVAGGGIVDEGAKVGTKGGAEDDEDDVEVAAIGCCTVGGGRYDKFAGDGDDCAFECHQEGDGPVIEMVETPSYEGGHFLILELKVNIQRHLPFRIYHLEFTI